MPWKTEHYSRSVALTCPIDSSIRIILWTPGICPGILGGMPDEYVEWSLLDQKQALTLKGCKIFLGGFCGSQFHHRDREVQAVDIYPTYSIYPSILYLSIIYQSIYLFISIYLSICIYCEELAFATVGFR